MSTESNHFKMVHFNGHFIRWKRVSIMWGPMAGSKHKSKGGRTPAGANLTCFFIGNPALSKRFITWDSHLGAGKGLQGNQSNSEGCHFPEDIKKWFHADFVRFDTCIIYPEPYINTHTGVPPVMWYCSLRAGCLTHTLILFHSSAGMKLSADDVFVCGWQKQIWLKRRGRKQTSQKQKLKSAFTD